MRVLIVALAFLSILAGRALAQVGLDSGPKKTPMQMIYEEEDKRRAQNDKDYQATMKRMRGNDAPAGPVDPWGNVRSSAPASSGKK